MAQRPSPSHRSHWDTAASLGMQPPNPPLCEAGVRTNHNLSSLGEAWVKTNHNLSSLGEAWVWKNHNLSSLGEVWVKTNHNLTLLGEAGVRTNWTHFPLSWRNRSLEQNTPHPKTPNTWCWKLNWNLIKIKSNETTFYRFLLLIPGIATMRTVLAWTTIFSHFLDTKYSVLKNIHAETVILSLRFLLTIIATISIKCYLFFCSRS